ncbi:34636_t:CDS:2, partial [Racocetra persica]
SVWYFIRVSCIDTAFDMEWEVLLFVKHDDSISKYINFESTDKEKIKRFVTAIHK